MSTPGDSKIDFEKLTLSEDASGLLEPIADGGAEGLLPEQKPEAEPLALEELLEEEEKTERAEAFAAQGAEIQQPSIKRGLLEKLSTADPFTVMLAVTVAALAIAILCCLVELGRYGFHISAKEARSTLTMIAPIDIPHWFC